MNMINRYVLKNNINYYLGNIKDYNNFYSLILVFKTGSQNDKEQKGISHFLEHQLLSFDRNKNAIENITGKVSGVTKFDATYFRIDCECLEKDLIIYLDILKGIIFGNNINNAEYLKQTKSDILLEFKKFKKTNLYVNIFEELVGDELESLPIGNKKIVQKITCNDLFEFYKKVYLSTSKCLIILGNFETKKMIKSIDTLFSSIPDDIKSTDIKNYYLKNEVKISIKLIHESIYIFYKQLENNNIYNYKSKDILRDVFRLVISEYINIYYNQRVNTECYNMKYNKYFVFNIIKITKEKNIKSLYSFIKKKKEKILYIYFKYIYNNISEKKVKKIFENYKNDVMNKDNINRELLFKSAYNNFVYNELLYFSNEYATILEEINTIQLTQDIKKELEEYLKILT